MEILLERYTPYMSTVSLTSKNQLTIPVALLRERDLAPGTKFSARWQGSELVLTPIRELADVVVASNAALAPYIRSPLSDEHLKQNLRDWPRDDA